MTKALSNEERVELRDLMTFETKIQKKEYHLTLERWKKWRYPKKKVLYLKAQKSGKIR